MKTSYKSSGVNIKKADIFVSNIKSKVLGTHSKEVIQGIGNFGAFYKPNLKKYQNPVFVSSVDGVGTKVKLASLLNKYDTVGEDLVNHCVNDIAVCGATPLFFLDYYATGKLDTVKSNRIMDGLIRGCKNNNISLIGGETAEMPGVYGTNDFDLAGAIFGIVNRNQILDKRNVKRGNVLIGIESNGLHTNGYSLVRKIFSLHDYKIYHKEFNDTLGNELLKVHKSYLNIISDSLQKFNINSISHITGGGIIGNTKRVVPENLKIKVNWSSWQWQPIFKLIMSKGKISKQDMHNTFNLGIGLIFILSKSIVDDYLRFLSRRKHNAYIVGEIF